MPIPASYIVAINPRLIQPGGTDLEFNGLILTDNALMPLSSMVMEFTTSDAVGSYFGLDSAEYAQATQYFLGYNNSFSKPKRLMFGARVNSARAAFLRGGKFTGTLATLQAVTDGAMKVTINGTEYTVTGLDFNSDTSYSDVAETVQTALAGELASTTVTYSSLTGGFQIGSPTTGAESTIGYASAGDSGTDVSALLCLTEATGAVLSQGSAALSATANMAAIKQQTQNWVSFTTLYEAETEEVLGLAEWASGQGVDYLYVPWSTDAQLTTQGSTSSIADQIEAAEHGATALVYENVDTAVFVLGTVASIDWNRNQGVITTAFKHIDGLAATVTDETTANLLESKKCNFIGTYATRNDDFTFFYPGAMFGDYNWIDTYINMIWLKNVMQVAVMNGLNSAGRVPYNERGYTLIRSWLQDPINRALKNGCIDTGVTLSESQKAQVMNEAGLDISNELWINGYYIQVEDAGAQVRVTRDSPNVSVWYTYAGSVQRVVVASTALV